MWCCNAPLRASQHTPPVVTQPIADHLPSPPRGADPLTVPFSATAAPTVPRAVVSRQQEFPSLEHRDARSTVLDGNGPPSMLSLQEDMFSLLSTIHTSESGSHFSRASASGTDGSRTHLPCSTLDAERSTALAAELQKMPTARPRSASRTTHATRSTTNDLQPANSLGQKRKVGDDHVDQWRCSDVDLGSHSAQRLPHDERGRITDSSSSPSVILSGARATRGFTQNHDGAPQADRLEVRKLSQGKKRAKAQKQPLREVDQGRRHEEQQRVRDKGQVRRTSEQQKGSHHQEQITADVGSDESHHGLVARTQRDYHDIEGAARRTVQREVDQEHLQKQEYREWKKRQHNLEREKLEQLQQLQVQQEELWRQQDELERQRLELEQQRSHFLHQQAREQLRKRQRAQQHAETEKQGQQRQVEHRRASRKQKQPSPLSSTPQGKPTALPISSRTDFSARTSIQQSASPVRAARPHCDAVSPLQHVSDARYRAYSSQGSSPERRCSRRGRDSISQAASSSSIRRSLPSQASTTNRRSLSGQFLALPEAPSQLHTAVPTNPSTSADSAHVRTQSMGSFTEASRPVQKLWSLSAARANEPKNWTERGKERKKLKAGEAKERRRQPAAASLPLDTVSIEFTHARSLSGVEVSATTPSHSPFRRLARSPSPSPAQIHARSHLSPQRQHPPSAPMAAIAEGYAPGGNLPRYHPQQRAQQPSSHTIPTSGGYAQGGNLSLHQPQQRAPSPWAPKETVCGGYAPGGASWYLVPQGAQSPSAPKEATRGEYAQGGESWYLMPQGAQSPSAPKEATSGRYTPGSSPPRHQAPQRAKPRSPPIPAHPASSSCSPAPASQRRQSDYAAPVAAAAPIMVDNMTPSVPARWSFHPRQRQPSAPSPRTIAFPPSPLEFRGRRASLDSPGFFCTTHHAPGSLSASRSMHESHPTPYRASRSQRVSNRVRGRQPSPSHPKTSTAPLHQQGSSSTTPQFWQKADGRLIKEESYAASFRDPRTKDNVRTPVGMPNVSGGQHTQAKQKSSPHLRPQEDPNSRLNESLYSFRCAVEVRTPLVTQRSAQSSVVPSEGGVSPIQHERTLPIGRKFFSIPSQEDAFSSDRSLSD